MNLLKPLVLKKAHTAGLNLVPTESHFKPVIIVSAEIGVKEAQLLEVDYLWTAEGAPRTFDGTHKIHGDLLSAEVTFKPANGAPTVILTQKVCKLNLSPFGDAMQITMRVHLPDEEDPDQRKLNTLISFLARLNKDGYSFTVKPGQRSLIEQTENTGEPADVTTPVEGLLDKEPNHTEKFQSKLFAIEFGTVETDDGCIPWYQVIVKLKGAAPLITGEQPRVDSTVFGSRALARTSAIRSAMEVIEKEELKAKIDAADQKYHRLAVEALQGKLGKGHEANVN